MTTKGAQRLREGEAVLCVDVGSTFTKAALVDADTGELLATAAHRTTLPSPFPGGSPGGDVLDAVHAVRAAVEERAGCRAGEVLACSSAGGGLRIAVVGYERLVTAEAGRRVALSAGGRVVHVHAGPMTPADVDGLRAARPDVVLLAGGTDGGDGDVLLANARRLAIARIAAPVVVAGNAEAAPAAVAELERRRRKVALAPNVLPRIGTLEPLGARSAIRELFLEHVIGGKGLSRGPAFARLVRAPTPDAVLTGVEVLAASAGGDVLAVDVGGATTDVYSVLSPQGEDAPDDRPGAKGLAREVVAPLWRARTVEGDLGMRWTAPGVVAAAAVEGLLAPGEEDGLGRYAAAAAADPGVLPPDTSDGSPDGWEPDTRLAELAVTLALRRHGRPATATSAPRPLRDVRLVVGSGGVLRHAGPVTRERILAAATGDHGGGWRVPERARSTVDERYVLFAAGLLAGPHPAAALALARLIV
jgi:uncharacterized protein (TIGR01319 family)